MSKEITQHDLDELLSEVTRVELIDITGRTYTNHNVKRVIIQLQNDNRTLKVFVKSKEGNNVSQELYTQGLFVKEFTKLDGKTTYDE